MTLEVLISTLNNNNIIKLLKDMNVQTSAIIVNQCDKNFIETTTYNGNLIKIINTNTKGLSVSRNIALNNATADILVIADDNQQFVDNYMKMITSEHEKNKSAVICFNMIRKNDDRKVKKTTKKIGYINAMRISSSQITLKRNVITQKNIFFDEDFGSGSKYTLGEETIFLYECIRNKLKVVFCDKLLVIKNSLRKSTWYKGMDKDYLISRGAAFYRMSKALYKLNVLQFAFRKKREYIKNNITMKDAIYYMQKGAKEYIEYRR